MTREPVENLLAPVTLPYSESLQFDCHIPILLFSIFPFFLITDVRVDICDATSSFDDLLRFPFRLFARDVRAYAEAILPSIRIITRVFVASDQEVPTEVTKGQVGLDRPSFVYLKAGLHASAGPFPPSIATQD